MTQRESEIVMDMLGTCDDPPEVGILTGTVAAIGVTNSQQSVTPEPETDALTLYDDNGNGRITCAEARVHGIVRWTQETGQVAKRESCS